ncbi:hypothetical protein J6590_031763 [Homalodisca vitripennis]|nr:hypothetical protein J6590_031763 [Homalodisca vitripennis]
MTEKVKILTGGATGLEPLHSGLVGHGMSTGAVFGDVTSSPPYMNIVVALRLLGRDHTRGVLVIVTNNLADRLNFGLACQKVAQEGIHCLCLTVGDDCAGLENGHAGKRGFCGIAFLLKIAGAMAEEEKSLYEIYWLVNSLNGGSLRTVNIALDSGVLNVGTGLGGEPGSYCVKANSLTEATKEALMLLLSPDAPASIFVEKEESIAIIINNFGKLSDFHFSLIVRTILNIIYSVSVNVVRVYIGRFLSAPVTQGFSISVLKLDEKLLKWLDFPVGVTSWSNRGNTVAGISPAQDWFSYYNSLYITNATITTLEDPYKDKNMGSKFTPYQAAVVVKAILNIIDCVINAEDHLNELDSDHDYGTTLKKFILNIKSEMEMRVLNIVTPYGLLNDLAEIAAVSMGGISGAVFSVIFASAAQAFLSSSTQTPLECEKWISACRMAKEGLISFTHVRPGDRTILDTLHNFVEAFTDPTLECLTEAVNAAKDGVDKSSQPPDPGAWILAEVLQLVLIQVEVLFSNDEADENDEEEDEIQENKKEENKEVNEEKNEKEDFSSSDYEQTSSEDSF